ncbi:hypothetical protein CYMTET_36479 [Cymbomonas tetramitiformis]|uniref:PHD-type domain-containing protein n=1 Tax=Cymbomonas tetramitiformis TaxID=36881 RepID=A0AAE0F7U2_9CHLO|nr:hypothetical protein CYMTET_36479 [Cymbomonas tetramitiformis]
MPHVRFDIDDSDLDDEDDKPCMLCGERDSTPENPMLLSDGAAHGDHAHDDAYHARCLHPPISQVNSKGHVIIPKGDWFCPRCTSTPNTLDNSHSQTEDEEEEEATQDEEEEEATQDEQEAETTQDDENEETEQLSKHQLAQRNRRARERAAKEASGKSDNVGSGRDRGGGRQRSRGRGRGRGRSRGRGDASEETVVPCAAEEEDLSGAVTNVGALTQEERDAIVEEGHQAQRGNTSKAFKSGMNKWDHFRRHLENGKRRPGELSELLIDEAGIGNAIRFLKWLEKGSPGHVYSKKAKLSKKILEKAHSALQWIYEGQLIKAGRVPENANQREKPKANLGA